MAGESEYSRPAGDVIRDAEERIYGDADDTAAKRAQRRQARLQSLANMVVEGIAGKFAAQMAELSQQQTPQETEQIKDPVGEQPSKPKPKLVDVYAGVFEAVPKPKQVATQPPESIDPDFPRESSGSNRDIDPGFKDVGPGDARDADPGFKDVGPGTARDIDPGLRVVGPDNRKHRDIDPGFTRETPGEQRRKRVPEPPRDKKQQPQEADPNQVPPSEVQPEFRNVGGRPVPVVNVLRQQVQPPEPSAPFQAAPVFNERGTTDTFPQAESLDAIAGAITETITAMDQLGQLAVDLSRAMGIVQQRVHEAEKLFERGDW